jgi:hypothetical protein
MDAEQEFKQLSFAKKLFWRMLSGGLGAAASAAFLFLFFLGVQFVTEIFDLSRGRIRFPVIALILPLVGFFSGWKQAEIFQPFVSLLFKSSLFFRLFVFASVFYMASLSAFIEIFEPDSFRQGLSFHNYDFNGRFGYFLKLLLFPPVCLAFGLILLNRVKPRN